MYIVYKIFRTVGVDRQEAIVYRIDDNAQLVRDYFDEAVRQFAKSNASSITEREDVNSCIVVFTMGNKSQEFRFGEIVHAQI